MNWESTVTNNHIVRRCRTRHAFVWSGSLVGIVTLSLLNKIDICYCRQRGEG
ncbi:hypothetical protein BJ878DRAFT_577252 [Calycina marina]|uniref:Uncharacterized protein n=1 Tax=Calycina marina TaxID=1763456 RepID=A0A9P8CD39_9HELO|nr:hypothetical protein BJ878DRAFT_577252 [Calycina marina]